MATAKSAVNKVATGSDVSIALPAKLSEANALLKTHEGYVASYGGDSPVSMDIISKQNREWTLKMLLRSGEIGRAAYVTAAKCIVRLESLLKKGETKYGVLLAAGFKKSNIQNGTQLADVWTDLVEPGHITEAVFDRLVFRDALNLKRVADKRSKNFIRDLFKGDADAALDEIEFMADAEEGNGMTRLEKKDMENLAKAKKDKAEADRLAAEQQAEKDAEEKDAETPPTAPAKVESKSPTPSAKAETEATPEPSSVTEATTEPAKAQALPKAAPAPAKASAKDKSTKDKLAELRLVVKSMETLAMEILASGTPAEVQETSDLLSKLAAAIEDHATDTSRLSA